MDEMRRSSWRGAQAAAALGAALWTQGAAAQEAVSDALAAVLSAEALAEAVTEEDAERLAGYEAVKAGALDQAYAEGDKTEFATIAVVLAKPALSFSGFDMTGDWRCRTTKMGGGLTALTPYGWFRCRVVDDGSGLVVEKLTGSQRTRGRLYAEGDRRLVYLGAGYYNDDPPLAYGLGARSDEPGYVLRGGANEWRIEFPSPAYESNFNVLEFRR